MGPQARLDLGRVVVEVYGGYGEIGGNCIVVRDRGLGRTLVFDVGVRFSVLRRLYRGRIEPLGPRELEAVGAIPPRRVLEGADAVYVTHFHLDHLGLLYHVPPGVEVRVPSLSVLEAVSSWYRGSRGWTAYVPPRPGARVSELRPLEEDEYGVTPVPVSHSAYPAYALLYRGSATILYTGDFRLHSPRPHVVRESVEALGRAVGGERLDLLIVEATNVGAVYEPVEGGRAVETVTGMAASPGLLAVTLDPLDREMLEALTEAARLTGRRLVVGSRRVYLAARAWGLGVDHVLVESGEPPGPGRPVLIEEVEAEPEAYIVVHDLPGLLEEARRRWLHRGPGFPVTVVLTTPQPRDLEWEVEEAVAAEWLASMGVSVARVRVSGHYYPHSIHRLAGIVRAERLLPIHTRSIEAAQKFLDKTLTVY